MALLAFAFGFALGVGSALAGGVVLARWLIRRALS
jgi:hypothetical protein